MNIGETVKILQNGCQEHKLTTLEIISKATSQSIQIHKVLLCKQDRNGSIKIFLKKIIMKVNFNVYKKRE